MFNRNVNGKQFDLDALDSPALSTRPAAAGGPPTHRRNDDAIRVPLAGGEFIADGEDGRTPFGGTSEPRTQREGYSMGHWISQSAETVLPGGAAWHTDDAGDYAVSFKTDEEDSVASWRRMDQGEAEGVMIEGGYHGVTTYKNGRQSIGVGGPRDVSVYDNNDVGFTTTDWEGTGTKVREILAKQKAAREERERKDLV